MLHSQLWGFPQQAYDCHHPYSWENAPKCFCERFPKIKKNFPTTHLRVWLRFEHSLQQILKHKLCSIFDAESIAISIIVVITAMEWNWKQHIVNWFLSFVVLYLLFPYSIAQIEKSVNWLIQLIFTSGFTDLNLLDCTKPSTDDIIKSA